MIKYKKGYRFQITADYRILTPVIGYDVNTDWCRLTSGGWLVVYAKYAYDGRSGLIRRKKTKTPSLVHDVFSQMARQGLILQDTKPIVDNLYRDMLIERGVSKWYANADLFILRKLNNYYDPKNKRKILCAP